MIYSYVDWTFKAYIFQIFLELCLAGNTFNIFLHPIIFKRMQIKYHFYHRSSSNGMMMMIRSIWLINRYKHLRGNKKGRKSWIEILIIVHTIIFYPHNVFYYHQYFFLATPQCCNIFSLPFLVASLPLCVSYTTIAMPVYFSLALYSHKRKFYRKEWKKL